MPAAPRLPRFSTRTIRSAVEFAAISDDWERCNAACGQTHYEGHLDHLLHGNQTADGGRNLMAVLLYEGDRMVGMAPLAIYRHEVTWQVRLRRRRWTVLSFDMDAVEFIGSRLIAPDSPEAQQTLLQGIIDACRSFDVVRFRYLMVGLEPWTSITSSARARGHRWAWALHRDVSLEIRVQESFDSYVRTLSKKSRHNMRRELRLLNAAAGSPLRLTAVTDISQVPAFLEAAGHVFEKSWHARHGATRIGADPKTEARLNWLASNGWLRAYLLSKGSEPIAFILGWHYRGTLTAHRVAYSLPWSRYSPGKVLWWLVIEDIHSSKTIDRINFGIGDWEYKRVLATDVHQVANVWLIKPSLRTAVAWSGPWLYRKARNGLERGLRVAGVGDPIMKWLRRNMAR